MKETALKGGTMGNRIVGVDLMAAAYFPVSGFPSGVFTPKD